MAVELAFDPHIYRDRNPDLSALADDDQLIRHYHLHGYAEGRVCCDVTTRQDLMVNISDSSGVLEIGAFVSPLTSELEAVDHFDVLDQQQLTQRAQQFGFPTHLIPEIKYVHPEGDLSVVPRSSYDVVISCHVIEHQPCLVRHLNQVMDLLTPRGRYVLVVPDKRFTFDQPLPPSRLSEIIDAYYHGRRRHSLTAVIDDAFATSHNDWKRHWLGDHASESKDLQAVLEAIQRYRSGEYIDVHSWRFTPLSFEAVLNELVGLGLIASCFRGKIYPTISGAHEFFVVIQKE